MAEITVERGLLIVVEGLDRSGKSTQCELLCKNLMDEGRKAKYVKFPDRNTATGKMINSYLTGEAQQDDHAIHLLFSANRWEAASRMRKDIADGTSLVIDRYSFSGAVYSAAKKRPDLSLQWAWAPEVGLPKPDIVLFLDISAEAAASRGGYGAERYEKEEMQAKVRHLFRQLFSTLQLDNMAYATAMIDAGQNVETVTTEMAKKVSNVQQDMREKNLLKALQLASLSTPSNQFWDNSL